MTSDPVIDPHTASSPLRLLDVRDADSFAAAHALGAVRVPIEAWVSAARTQAGGLENAAHWATALDPLGIGPEGVAGIYDDGRMVEAARVWFILQYFGVPAVILALWLVPVALLFTLLGTEQVFAQIAGFFSVMAVVTFGGAYAVLACVAQEVVQNFGGLAPGDMLDRLGMAFLTV